MKWESEILADDILITRVDEPIYTKLKGLFGLLFFPYGVKMRQLLDTTVPRVGALFSCSIRLGWRRP